jgi:hypothetical protein
MDPSPADALAQIEIEADIPRTPGLVCPSVSAILASPPQDSLTGQSLTFDARARCDQQAGNRLPGGLIAYASLGVIFLATGPDESPGGETLVELAKHALWHIAGAAGAAFMSSVLAKRDIARALESPYSFVFPATAVTGLRVGSSERDGTTSLIVTCADDEGTRVTFTLVPAAETKAFGSLIWKTRFLYDLGVSFHDQLSRAVPAGKQQLFTSKYYEAYFKTRGAPFEVLRRIIVVKEVTDCLAAPVLEKWLAAFGQALYRVQSFRDRLP